MTEIPLPSSDGYVEPKKPKSGGGCNKMLCIAVIAIIVIGGIVATALLGGSGEASRVINTWTDADVEQSTWVYYRDEFTVSSAEVEFGRPWLLFEVSIDNGNDAGSVDISMHVYECSMATVDAASSWDDLSVYSVGWGWSTGTMDDTESLEDYPQTYTWVLEFDYDGTKIDVWDCDMTITLFYYTG